MNTLQRIVERFEAARQHLFGDESWPCDVGAVALAYLADEAKLERTVVTGPYWHNSLSSYYKTIGEDCDPMPDEVENHFIEECHTWIEITVGPDSFLVDPNGEMRGEPRVQPVDSAVSYERFPSYVDIRGLEPDIKPETLIAEGWDDRLRLALNYFKQNPALQLV